MHEETETHTLHMRFTTLLKKRGKIIIRIILAVESEIFGEGASLVKYMRASVANIRCDRSAQRERHNVTWHDVATAEWRAETTRPISTTNRSTDLEKVSHLTDVSPLPCNPWSLLQYHDIFPMMKIDK